MIGVRYEKNETVKEISPYETRMIFIPLNQDKLPNCDDFYYINSTLDHHLRLFLKMIYMDFLTCSLNCVIWNNCRRLALKCQLKKLLCFGCC